MSGAAVAPKDLSTSSKNIYYGLVARDRVAQVDQALAEAQRRLADPAFQHPDTRAATEKAIADLEAAKQALETELDLRGQLDAAYNGGKGKKVTDSDPAVAAAQGKLNEHRKAAHQLYADRNSLVGDPCLPCLTKDQKKALKSLTGIDWWKYGRRGGPHFGGSHPLSAYADWKGQGVLTEADWRILCAVSPNEGGTFDAVNGYDDQILTVGAMQKTIDPDGHGQLADQLADLQKNDPAAYKELFEDKGWTVEMAGGKATVYYQKPVTPPATPMDPITGDALSDYIRQPDDPARWEETVGPWAAAGADPRFQAQQVRDFNTQLGEIRGYTPPGYDNHLDQYITSEYGQSLLLDEYVNRPGYAPADATAALNEFYADNPAVSRNPSDWTASQRETYEAEILANYLPRRNADGRMTHGPTRADTLAQKPNLSHAPGSGTKLPDPPPDPPKAADPPAGGG